MNKLFGLTPAQWVTCFKEFPPTTYDMKGVANAKKNWFTRYVCEPSPSPVTPGFGAAWDRFLEKAKLVH